MARAKRSIALSDHISTLAAFVCVTALTTVIFHTVTNFNLAHDARDLFRWYGLAWGLFALAVAAVRFVPVRAAVALIVAGGLALGLVSLASQPRTSTDSARYVWDGIVQESGESPYTYAPADGALTKIRPDWLFPEARQTPAGPTCPGWEPHLTEDSETGKPLCTAINRPQVHTIYPGMAEIYFFAVALLSPADAEYLPLQIAGLLVATAITLLLLWGLRRNGLDPRWAALWAWCPLMASEAVNNAHVDVVGAFFALLAVLLLAGRRYGWGGIAAGAAVAVKLIPGVLLPALIRRRPVRVLAGVVGAFVVAYLPYVVTSGSDVVGFFPGYLEEEGYQGDNYGSRFTLIRMVVPNEWATVSGAIVLAVVAALVLWRANPDWPWVGATTMIGTALLVTTPSYPWYSLLLIPLVALSARWEWLAVAAACSASYLAGSAGGHGWAAPFTIAQLGFGTAAVIVVAMSVLRAYLVRRPVGVAAGEVADAGEAELPQQGQGVGGPDAVGAVDDDGSLGRKGGNQLGYALLGVGFGAGITALTVGLARRFQQRSHRGED